jgi:hypothetical protein
MRGRNIPNRASRAAPTAINPIKELIEKNRPTKPTNFR